MADPEELVLCEAEVVRLKRRVAELELAFDMEKGVERELEAEAIDLEDRLRARLQRDAHVVAVERERDELRHRLDVVRGLWESYPDLQRRFPGVPDGVPPGVGG